MPGRLLSALLLCAGLCACATPHAALRGYSAAYTTHFEGIPDLAGVCANVTNRGVDALEWVELRMDSESDLGELPASWRSTWAYEGRIEPGQTLALALLDPPAASRVELKVRAAGSGVPPVRGRPMVRVPECSDAWLGESLRERVAGRTAPGIAVVRAERAGEADLLAEAPE